MANIGPRTLRARLLTAASALALVAASTVSAPAQTWNPPSNVLYIESNSTAAGKNSVLGYHRLADGSLVPLAGSPFLTGGTGWFDPTYAVGPFDADGILAVDRHTGSLFVPNGGSDSIASFHIKADGTLAALAGSPTATTSDTPEALAYDGRLIVVSNGLDPLQAGPSATASYVTGTIIGGEFKRSGFAPIDRPVSVTPTQAKPIVGTQFVLANEFTGGTISSYFLDFSGQLHLIERQGVPQEGSESGQPLPLGLAVNPVAPFVYAGLPNVGRVAVFRWDETGHLHYRRAVANSGIAVCWLAATPDGARLYTTNTGDNSVSLYDLHDPDRPVETAHVLLHGAKGGSFQIALSPDGRFLYTVEQENSPAAAGLSNKIHILSINPASGVPNEIANSPLALPVPAGNRPQGLIVY